MQHFIKRLFILALTSFSCTSLFAAHAQVRMQTSEQKSQEEYEFKQVAAEQVSYCPISVGLTNPRNRCYLNASLQCLVPLSPLWIRLVETSNLYEKGSLGDVYKQFFDEYFKVWSGTYHADLIYDALKNMHNKGECHLNIAQDRQEDAAELLTILLKAFTNNKVASNDNPFSIKEIATTRCNSCGFTYEKELEEGKFNTQLPLAITHDSLEACMVENFKEENIEKQCQLFCQSNQNTQHTRKILWEHAPDILCVTLKRFDNEGNKSIRHVAFPMNNLDMKANIVHDEPATYDLMGCIMHRGNSRQNGHYVAYVNWNGNRWYLFDDETRTPLPKNFDVSGDFTARAETAYVLFYEKRDAGRAIQKVIKDGIKKGQLEGPRSLRGPAEDKKPKSSAASAESLSARLNTFFFGSPQRSLLSLSFFVGAFILIHKLFMKPQK